MAYPTDLTDDEWNLIHPHLPLPNKIGRPRTIDFRSICHAIYYHLRTGCQWHYLPNDFPCYQTVYHYYRKWQRKGIWQSLNRLLRDQCRHKVGKTSQPTVAIADSQSIETTEKRGELYGFDGGKKVKGRKRQILVDSLGLLLKVVVAEANGSERVLAATAVLQLLEEEPYIVDKLQLLWVDSGYKGDRFALSIWLMIQAKVEVIKRETKEFKVLPKRWTVERTFGWFNWYRRLSKDYERLPEVSETAIYAVMTRIMLRRLVS